MDTYVLVPRDSADLDSFIAAVRSAPSPLDVDAVIGILGPIAPPSLCGGLSIPIVFVDQIYSFSRAELLNNLPFPKGANKERFSATADEILQRVMQSTDNAGISDAHRAMNYAALRYGAIYAEVYNRHANNYSLTEIETRRSTINSGRRIMEIIYSFTHRETGFVDKRFCRIDTSDEFPFLVTNLSNYFDQ